MLWSAVSCLLGLSAGVGQGLRSDEQQTWAKVRSSVVTVLDRGLTVGVAVALNEEGPFLAHQSIARRPDLTGQLPSGAVVRLRQTAGDGISQLILLEPVTPLPTRMNPVTLAQELPSPGERVLGVVGSGPLRMAAGRERVGIMTAQRRAVPLGEMSLEGQVLPIGGAVIFDLEGRLVGILNATLPTPTRPPVVPPIQGVARPEGLPKTSQAVTLQQYGPGSLTVAYTVSPSVLKRVREGLTGPDRKVEYPALGAFCRDVEEGPGARIASLIKGSPADAAGLRVGDVLLEIAGRTVSDQLAFARIVMDQTVDSVVPIRYRRGFDEFTVDVRVGAFSSALNARPQVADQ